MNSFNHYAYGSVADWVYSVAAGINPVEEAPGYAKVRIAPIPDARLDWLKGALETRHVSSSFAGIIMFMTSMIAKTKWTDVTYFIIYNSCLVSSLIG